jgi:hypothetical protein
MMKPPFCLLLLITILCSCRDYDLAARLADQDGLVPADQFARYGREQAEAMAIAREYAQNGDGSAATNYARTQPDVIDARTDSLGFRETLRFKSGWLTMVVPVDDGKRGSETTGLPAGPAPATAP